MSWTHFFFDWSGTLLNDFEAVNLASQRTMAHFGREDFGAEDLRHYFKQPVQKFYQEQLPGIPLTEIDTVYFKALATQRPAQLNAGARQLLQFLKDKGRDVHLISTLPDDVVITDLLRLQCHPYFRHIHPGLKNKIWALPKILKKLEINPKQVLYCGDLPHDAEAAHQAGVTFAGFASGFSPSELLRMKAGPYTFHSCSAIQAWLETRL